MIFLKGNEKTVRRHFVQIKFSNFQKNFNASANLLNKNFGKYFEFQCQANSWHNEHENGEKQLNDDPCFINRRIHTFCDNIISLLSILTHIEI